jgi:SAM-dependent methyltransferase
MPSAASKASFSDLERQRRDGVREAYSAAADEPRGRHPFPLGHAFAASLGYPEGLLRSLPEVAVEAFTGVSNLAVTAEIPSGARVLDLGCGAGLDSLIAAGRTGREGSVLAVDFSAAMLDRARRAAAQAGVGQIEFREAAAEHLPIADASIDVALVNGLFNLNPARSEIFGELARVVRPGGRVFAAELILTRPLPASFTMDESNWFA